MMKIFMKHIDLWTKSVENNAMMLPGSFATMDGLMAEATTFLFLQFTLPENWKRAPFIFLDSRHLKMWHLISLKNIYCLRIMDL